jgi:hypothetical protein
MSHFRELLKLFQARFLESDALAEGSGYETNIAQILGILVTPGLLVSLWMLPQFMDYSFSSRAAADWALRSDRLFFAAYSFSVTGFATVFEWDTLFPERRDFLVLTPFPIRMRDLFAAKLMSLLIFVAIVATAVNAASVVLIPVFSTFMPQARNLGVFRLLLMQITSCGAAAAFGFFAVAATQGVLINLLSPRAFRRLSPYFQMLGMSAMVLSLLLFPIYSNVRIVATTHPAWLWLFPPYWFGAMQELFSAKPDPLFGALGWFGWRMTGYAVALFGLAWAAGFRRHYRRTLESEEIGVRGRAQGGGSFGWMLRSPQERAVFHFSGAILARSTKHRLFLATYLSAGISFGILVMVVVKNGAIGISPEGVRAFPLLVTFFAISGLRAGFQFPAELASNWVFQLAESGWGSAARDGARRRALVSGLLPPLLVFLPFELVRWGLADGLLHIAFQASAGAVLIEALFWKFDKVPFTCSYFPGKVSLAVLAALYLYGFTSYSFTMSDVEASLEHSLTRSIVFFGGSAIALAALWRRKSRNSKVLFEAGDPHIQALNLN